MSLTRAFDSVSRRAALAATALLFPILLVAQNYVFGPNVRVNDDAPGSHGHLLNSPGRRNIAATGDTVYVAEASDRADDGYFHSYFARSTNGGASFLPSVRVDSDQDVYSGPSLALDDSGNVHLCWGGRTLTGDPCISYTKSTDGGRSFAVPIEASETCWFRSASIAVSRSGQRVYIARDQGTWPDYDVFLSGSTDGGRTFSIPETRVNSDTVRTAKNPTIAVFNDTSVLVAWDDFSSLGGLGVSFSRSTDAGASFETARLLSDTTADDTGRTMASIGIDSTGGVYVACEHPGHALSLFFSQDTGRSFRSEQAIPGTAGEYPSLWASADGKLYVSYDISAMASEYVQFVFSPDRGTTFLAPVNPSDAPDWAWGSSSTVTANDQGRVFVAWEDTRNDSTYWNDDIYLATGAMAAIAEPEPHRSAAVVCSVWPNPSRAPVHVEYFGQRVEPTSVGVYDLSGRLVRQLNGCCVGSGRRVLTWDGRNTRGTAVDAGIYFVRVQTPAGSLTRKVLFVRE